MESRVKILFSLGVFYIITFQILCALPGDLDPTFGGKNGDIPGTVVGDFAMLPDDEAAQSVAMQPDRKIVVGSNVCGTNFVDIVRFFPDGNLDNNFGRNGVARIDVGVDDVPAAIVIQPDGKILVSILSNWIQARLTSSGELDPTFGMNGVISEPSLAGAESRSLSLLPDGKYIVVGESCPANQIVLTRHLPDGSLDTDFGTNGTGIVTYDLNNPSDTLHALLNDGTIVVTAVADEQANPNNIFVAKFTPDGILDTSFNPLGKFMGTAGSIDPGTVIFDYEGLDNNKVGSITLQKDGKILVAFLTETNPPNLNAVGILRLNPDGSIDAGYNPDGMVPGVALVVGKTGFQNLTPRKGMVVQADGKVVLEFSAGDANNAFFEQFGVARLNQDGTLDRSFGGFGANPEGTVVFDHFEMAADASTPLAIILQADGKIVIVGDTSDVAATFDDVVVMRAQSGIIISKIAQAIFGKYALTSDINRTSHADSRSFC